MNEHKTSVFSNGLLWFGAGISIAEILTGMLLAPLGFAKAFAAIILGHLIGGVVMYLAGLIGGRTGGSAMETVRISFGTQGAKLFAGLNVIQLIGWTAVMVASAALAANTIAAIGVSWWSLIIGAFIAVWIVMGLKNLSKINVVVMAALFLSSRSRGHDTDKVTSAKGVAYMVVSVLSGAASALWDKVILKNLEPLFVQSWANLYITVLLALVLLVHYLVEKEQFQRFTWDWSILLIAVLITVADALYFFAMKDPNGMVSIISMIRRTSVVVTFVGGALLFKEGHIRDKAVVMVLMLTGVALLLGGWA